MSKDTEAARAIVDELLAQYVAATDPGIKAMLLDKAAHASIDVDIERELDSGFSEDDWLP